MKAKCLYETCFCFCFGSGSVAPVPRSHPMNKECHGNSWKSTAFHGMRWSHIVKPADKGQESRPFRANQTALPSGSMQIATLDVDFPRQGQSAPGFPKYFSTDSRSGMIVHYMFLFLAANHPPTLQITSRFPTCAQPRWRSVPRIPVISPQAARHRRPCRLPARPTPAGVSPAPTPTDHISLARAFTRVCAREGGTGNAARRWPDAPPGPSGRPPHPSRRRQRPKPTSKCGRQDTGFFASFPQRLAALRPTPRQPCGKRMTPTHRRMATTEIRPSHARNTRILPKPAAERGIPAR